MNAPELKTQQCAECREERSQKDFSPYQRRKPAEQRRCRSCAKLASRMWNGGPIAAPKAKPSELTPHQVRRMVIQGKAEKLRRPPSEPLALGGFVIWASRAERNPWGARES